MSDPTGPPEPDTVPDADPDEGEREDRRAATAIVAVLLVAALVALAWWLLSDDEDDEPTTTTTTTEATTTSTSSTTPSSETTASTEPPFAPTLSEDELATVVWPDPGSSRRFDDPVAAARAFAVDFLGFQDPVVGELRQGDARSGEVDVRPVADGPATTVLVRRLGDDSWWILGSTTPDVQVDEPAAGDTVGNPVAVSGSALAFEGNVEVLVLEDGSTEPIGQGAVTGGGGGEAAPFEGEIPYDAGSPRWGAVVFRTTSAEDGRVWQATVVRVRLGG